METRCGQYGEAHRQPKCAASRRVAVPEIELPGLGPTKEHGSRMAIADRSGI